MTMSEKEKASYYKKHKDDPDVWSDEAETSKPQSTLGASITIRIASDDAKLLRDLAKRTGLRYSEIVRQAVSNYVRPQFSFDYAIVRQIFGDIAPPESASVWTFESSSQGTETAASNTPLKRQIPA